MTCQARGTSSYFASEQKMAGVGVGVGGWKQKREERGPSGKIKNWRLKGWDGGKEVWMEVGRIGNWNPEKANFPLP